MSRRILSFLWQAIVWLYKRNDGSEDPPKWAVTPDVVQNLARRGRSLLEGIRRLPGHDDFGKLDPNRLTAWLKIVRSTCAELGRLEVADIQIGILLAQAPIDEDGVWPCEPVREVMEDIRSKDISSGAHTGLFNNRGCWRGDSGEETRALAQKYRDWARRIQYSHPFVASSVLMELANTYDRQAGREDAEAGIRRRLH